MYPHRIRLRGPWEADPIDPPAPSRRVTLPARFSDFGLEGCRSVKFRRRFGRPRQLDAEERVWLIGDGLTGRADFRLNGQVLGVHAGSAEPFAFPVTELLLERNELLIHITAHDPDSGLWGDVALEIRRRAWLKNVEAEPAGGGCVRVSGLVAGKTDGPMDLYVLAGGHSIGYAACTTAGPFEITTDVFPTAAKDLRVELVGGAVVWYVVEVPSP